MDTISDEIIDRTRQLKSFVCDLGIDLVGVCDLRALEGMPVGMPSTPAALLGSYHWAVVLGLPLRHPTSRVSGTHASLRLERAGLGVLGHIEDRGHRGLIVHTDDEYDPEQRYGLLSLKVLAKAAGLGWQGRSLLVISPSHGPLHRLIAILTNMPLHPDGVLRNRCGKCRRCVDMCPAEALTWVPFADHPSSREEVLDIRRCHGDDGCKVCLQVCPWLRRTTKASSCPGTIRVGSA